VSTQDRAEPFVAAVLMTLREMAGVEAMAQEMSRATGPDGFGDLSAVLRLSGIGEGYLILSFPNQTARLLAVRVLNGAAPLDDELIRDCAGEVANVVTGQAKALLAGTPNRFTFSTPTVIVGPPVVPAGEWWVVGFVSEVGPFRLHLRQPG
jgi:CheY-specific phosphatase CheX